MSNIGDIIITVKIPYNRKKELGELVNVLKSFAGVSEVGAPKKAPAKAKKETSLQRDMRLMKKINKSHGGII